MPVRFNAYPPDRPAVVQILDEGKPFRIGRAVECELRIDHSSVSRFHAELNGATGANAGWRLHDTGSKNGLRVDGHATLNMNFSASTWFAVGDVYCWLEFVDTRSGDQLPRTNNAGARVRAKYRAHLSHLDIGD